MKFDCGPTYQEKVQINNDKLSNWHRKFAWLPKRVGDRDCRWLEYIERKGERHRVKARVGFRDYWIFEYRPIKD